MKNYLCLLLLLPISFLSCDKEDKVEDDPVPERSAQEKMLMNHKWNHVSYVVMEGDEVQSYDLFSDPCFQDDYYEFRTDSTWTFYPVSPCDFELNSYGGTWRIVGNTFFAKRNSSNQEYPNIIKELTDSTFVYGSEYNEFKHTHTFKALD